MNRFHSRFPGEPSVADDLLKNACSLELKITRFARGETCLTFNMSGELYCSDGEIAEAFCDDDINHDADKARRQVAELLAALLDDDDEGRART